MAVEKMKAATGGKDFMAPTAGVGPDGKPGMFQPNKAGPEFGKFIPGVTPLNNFTANTQDALLNDLRAREQYNSLSAEQKAKLPFEKFRAAIAGQEHTFNTGQNAGPVPTVPTPAPIAPSGRGALQISGVPKSRGSFSATPSETDKPQIFRDELAAEQAKLASLSSPTPTLGGLPVPPERIAAEVARSNANIASLGRELQALGIPVSPQAAPQVAAAPQAATAPTSTITGIPGQTSFAGPLIENPAISPKEKQKLAIEKPHAESAASAVLQQLDRLDKVSTQLEKHPGLNDIVGKVNQYGALDVLPQTRDARALQSTLVKQIGVNALQTMREMSKTGGAVGSVSDREWPILQQSIAALDEAQSTSGYQTALQNLQAQTKSSMGRVKKAYEQSYGKLDFTPVPFSEKTTQETNRGVSGKIGAEKLTTSEQSELDALRKRFRK